MRIFDRGLNTEHLLQNIREYPKSRDDIWDEGIERICQYNAILRNCKYGSIHFCRECLFDFKGDCVRSGIWMVE